MLVAMTVFASASFASPLGLQETTTTAPDDASPAGDLGPSPRSSGTGRYKNRFSGLGLVSSQRTNGPGVGLRAFSLNSQSEGVVGFVRGNHFELAVVPSDDIAYASFAYRWMGGVSILPVESLRLAVVSGVGLQAQAFNVSSGTTSGDVGFVVPFMVEGGYAVTDNIGLHARVGGTFSALGFQFDDDSIGRLQDRPEFMLSASFGNRDGRRVQGFRIEGGRFYGVWTLMIGVGG